MQETRCKTLSEYIETLDRNSEARRQFDCLMTVSISRFFRDRQLWNTLRDEILPVLIKQNAQVIRVWSAGCASGEEVYTFKIVWEELRRNRLHMPDLMLLATDISPHYLGRARAGAYPESSIKEVPEAILSRYFEVIAPRGVVLRSWLKEGIDWQVHHLLSDPPQVAFDLIFLRNNLLTYYGDPLRTDAFKRVLACLTPGGFLVIGSHETLPVHSTALKQYNRSRTIFQRLT